MEAEKFRPLAQIWTAGLLKARCMTEKAEWVVWNGSLGVVDRVTIGHIEHSAEGRRACLAPPYDVVGPFDLDELEAQGRIAFGACFVMSNERWKQDQLDLRIEGQEKRRAIFARLDFDDEEDERRETLGLPSEGPITASDINAAFRKLAKTAHPDAGGSNEHYRRIAEARDALLDQYAD
jgi:hypothetical protein